MFLPFLCKSEQEVKKEFFCPNLSLKLKLLEVFCCGRSNGSNPRTNLNLYNIKIVRFSFTIRRITLCYGKALTANWCARANSEQEPIPLCCLSGAACSLLSISLVTHQRGALKDQPQYKINLSRHRILFYFLALDSGKNGFGGTLGAN